MTRLSVNINKVATLRNARGENIPDVVKFAIDCERFGAQGITVHPRPDERHITRQDVADLRKVVTTEFNIEGYPTDDFMRLVLATVPEQVTLVPDAPDALTSSAGWDVAANAEFLSTILPRLRQAGIRSSIFVSADPAQAAAPFAAAAEEARRLGIGLNAGHDLNLDNLAFFHRSLPLLDEVSIGHAIISDALYLGIETTIREYLGCLSGN